MNMSNEERKMMSGFANTIVNLKIKNKNNSHNDKKKINKGEKRC